MLRMIAMLILLAAAMLAAVWFAERPGQVSIVWQGWRLDTSFGVLVVAAAGVAIGAVLLAAAWRALVTGPQRFARWRRERRRRQGYSALTRGLVAVAAGDAPEARRHARRADVLLDEPPLTMLLAAQTAQLIGDEDEARRHFRRMLEKPDTEFLGLRGLITQALKAGRHDEALDLARRARGLRPQTAWVQTTLFELETRTGDWRAAQETLRQAGRIGALPPATVRRHEAAVALERSRLAAREARESEALAEAERAWKADPDHAAVAPWLAARYLAAGKSRAALRMIEQAWARAPHGDLVEPYLRARDAREPLARVKSAERLAALAPRHVESHLALARETLAARLWGEARRHLRSAIEAAGGPTRMTAQMMARLEQEERSDDAAARDWLARAAAAPRDPGWICGACGSVHEGWQAVCGHCGAFDRIAWSEPTRIGAPGVALPDASPDGPPVQAAGAARLPVVVDDRRPAP